MEHQLRGGIFRANAQRLSISLAPVVVQRSLMFRLNTDPALNASYPELTPTEESPALHTLSGTPQLVSGVLTPTSPASVYSQDSWKTASPFVPMLEVNPSQMPIPFTPGVQCSDIAEGDNDKEFTTKSISVLSVSSPPPDVSFFKVDEVNDTESHFTPDVMPSLANTAVRESVRSLLDIGSSSPFGKILTKMRSKSPKPSRSSKSFRKAMTRLSLQPSKWELVHLERANPIPISYTLRSLDFKLSEF